jgi:hypothetical protein
VIGKPLEGANNISDRKDMLEGVEAYMNEGSRDKDSGTKVLREKEDLWWNVHPCDLLCYNWETTSCNTGDKHND